MREKSGKETSWSRTSRNWKRWTHLISMQKRLNANEVLTPKKGEKIISPIADGTVKISGGDQVFRISTLFRDSPERGKNKAIFKENQTDLLQAHFETHRGMMGMLEMISGPSQEISFTVITWKPESKLYVRTEGPFPIPLKYIDVTRTTDTTLDVTSERNIDDYWNVDGDRELLDTWTGSTRFTILSEKSPDGCTWSWRRLTRKQTTSRPDKLWPEMWKHMSDASKRKEKQQWAIEKPKLHNARRSGGIYFSDPEDDEFKLLMRNVRRKLEIPMPAAMPSKTSSMCRSSRDTCRTIGGQKNKIRVYCWSWRINENPDGRISSQNHEDHIAGLGTNTLSHFNLVHKFISMPQAMKIPDAKGSSWEIMWKTRENICMAADESQKQERCDRWSKEWGQKSSAIENHLNTCATKKWGDRWSKEWGQNRTILRR